MSDKKLITKGVLQAIAVGGILIGSAAIPTLPMAAAGALNLWKEIKKLNQKDFGRIIKRLQKQEMISFKEEGDKVLIEITEKGKRRLLEYDFENIEIKAKKRDGKWHLVIFDIPEKKKNVRDSFRRKLLQLDLIKLQESVFASAFPCKEEVDFLCHFLGISDYVTIAKVDSIERGEQLIWKKYYDYGDD